MNAPSIDFLGGVGTVTGSKFLVGDGRSRVLVDCGLFQGLAPLRRRNWAPLTVPGLDAVLLTHAHLDHCGHLPALVRDGWRGPVYATAGTAELAAIVLRDSAHLMEQEAELANREGWSKHHPARPLYTGDDVERALRLVREVDYGKPVDVADGVSAEFGPAGHILGSAWIRVETGERSAVFSGDLGRPVHRLLAPPAPRPDCDALVLESTYGDRPAHQDETARLAEVITRTVRRGGSVLIPAFAVDRTQAVLVELEKLRERGEIPDVPVLLDSPMALAALSVYRRAVSGHWPEIRDGIGADPFDPGPLRELHSARESMSANHPSTPSIVVSASGMASGGRVLHHLAALLPQSRNAVVLVGFAAAGTRARALADGAREVKIHGRYVPVRAEIARVDGFSAHAGADELLAWATAGPEPEVTYLVHGEKAASEALAGRLRDEHRWTAVVPREGEHVLI